MSASQLLVGASAADWPAVEGLLRAERLRRPDAPVLIRADKDAPYRRVQRLLSAAKAAGAPRVAVAAEAE